MPGDWEVHVGLRAAVPFISCCHVLGRHLMGKWVCDGVLPSWETELWPQNQFLVSPQDETAIFRDEKWIWAKEKPLTYSSVAKRSRSLFQVWMWDLFTFNFRNSTFFFFYWKKNPKPPKTKFIYTPGFKFGQKYSPSKWRHIFLKYYFGISSWHLPKVSFYFSLQKSVLAFKIILNLQKRAFEGLISISPKSLKTL